MMRKLKHFVSCLLAGSVPFFSTVHVSYIFFKGVIENLS